MPRVNEDGTITVEVVRDGDLTEAITVDLTSADVGEFTVPAQVIIPAGADRVAFTLSGVEDGVVDGDQAVQLDGTAPGHNPASQIITVVDIDLPSLSFNFP